METSKIEFCVRAVRDGIVGDHGVGLAWRGGVVILEQRATTACVFLMWCTDFVKRTVSDIGGHGVS